MNYPDFNFSFGDDETPAVENEPVVSEPVDDINDEQIQVEFDAIVASTEADDEVVRAAQAIFEAENNFAEAEKAELEFRAEQVAAQRRVAELEAEMTKAKQLRDKLNAEMWGKRTARTRAEEAIRAAKKQKEIIEAAAATRQEMVIATEKYARIASQFGWYNGIKQGDKTLKVMPHQWDGMRFLASAERAILGDKMGVGKTLTAIGALDIAEAKKVLIVTPSDITTNFVNEIHTWANEHRPVLNLRGMSKSERNSILQVMATLPSVVIVINYESWRKDKSLLVRLSNVGFDTIIMDEAHVAKDTSSIVYRGLKEIINTNNFCPTCKIIAPANVEASHTNVCPNCGWNGQTTDDTQGMSWTDAYWMTKSIKRVWPMTGTPILNRPEDLFALVSLIDPVLFNNKQEFLRMYAKLDPYKGTWSFRSGGIDSLMKRLSGKFLGRSMKDAGIILPPQHPIVHEIELDPMQYAGQIRVINQITKHAQIMLAEDKKISIPAIIAIITRQRQANVWAGGIELKDPDTGLVSYRVGESMQESAKMDKALELIHEFTGEGERVVVFSQFSSALREFHQRINGSINEAGEAIFSVVFDGSTPDSVRSEIKTNFDAKMGENKKWDVVLANYKTGGVGLNLTAATHIIELDQEWNPGKTDQARARVYRIGQENETFVHKLVIPGTIDEWLDSILTQKSEMIAGFNDNADDLKAELLKRLNG